MAEQPAPAAKSARPGFVWEDPFLLDEELTEDERMIRDAARQNGYAGKAVRGALLRANGQLPQTTHRERWLRAHPEGVLLTGSGRMSKAQQAAIKRALAR